MAKLILDGTGLVHIFWVEEKPLSLLIAVLKITKQPEMVGLFMQALGHRLCLLIAILQEIFPITMAVLLLSMLIHQMGTQDVSIIVLFVTTNHKWMVVLFILTQIPVAGVCLPW